MTKIMSQSYQDRELDLDSFLFFLGVSIVPMDGIFVLFFAIASAL